MISLAMVEPQSPAPADGRPAALYIENEQSAQPRGRTPVQPSHTAETEAEAVGFNQRMAYRHDSHDSHDDHEFDNANDIDDHDAARQRPLPDIIYIVTDTCYPSASNFDNNIGITTIISTHTSKCAANERAKKTMYDNEGGCAVDIDKIIEEVKRGLYTGIGVGGKEEKDGCCFARKCEVEARIIDEDSDDDGSSDFGMENGSRDVNGSRDREDYDVDMG